MTKRRYQLIELRICSWTTYVLNSRVAVPEVFNTMVDLGISLANKLDLLSVRVWGWALETYGSEEVMQSIFAYSLLILMVLP